MKGRSLPEVHSSSRTSPCVYRPSAERRELLRESEALLEWDLQTELRDEGWDCLANLERVQSPRRRD